MDFRELSTFPTRPLESQAGFGKETGRHSILLTIRIRVHLCPKSDISQRSRLGSSV